MDEIVFQPDPDVVESSNLISFMRAHGLPSYQDLRERSVENPGWYWDAVIRHFDIQFYEPYSAIMDGSEGKAWTRWCVGGITNIVLNCLDCRTDDERETIVWEGESGEIRSWTLGELKAEVGLLAEGLRSLGLGAGDRVGLFMPMLPETVAAFFAIAKIGGIVVPLFSGFGPEALQSRLNDSGAAAIVTVDGTRRRGKMVSLKETADAAAVAVASVEHVIVLRNLGLDVAWESARDHWWHDLTEGQTAISLTEQLEADAPLLLGYTSGTTGKPKGCVHTHCGFLTKTVSDFRLCMDFKAGDRFLWFSDMGWLIGPITVVVSAFLGGTLIMAEGVPDYPEPDRLWRLIEDHRVSYLGVSPSLVRGMMRHGLDTARAYSFSDLRITVSGGETWTTDAWLWFFENICRRRVPILNNSGGTEMAGPIITATVLHPLKPCTVGEPMPGIDADVVNADGETVPTGELGELVLRQSLIGLTRGLWNDPERYIETYWSTIPDLWVHGDWASIDKDGHWYVHGRSDDTLKLAGKRTGPAEIEIALIDTGLVSEAAAVGVPDPVKGQALICVCVPGAGVTPGTSLVERLSEAVVAGLGSAYRPREIVFVSELPKTQAQKVMRRIVRSVFTGGSPGDLSALVNPGSVDELRAQVGSPAQTATEAS